MRAVRDVEKALAFWACGNSYGLGDTACAGLPPAVSGASIARFTGVQLPQPQKVLVQNARAGGLGAVCCEC